jgi:hypothetical protein
MDQVQHTKGSKHIELLMQQLPPDSERYQVLATAKRFKSSWIELGAGLARVSISKLFSEWGFASFEDYCTKEIRIRRQTAEKLLLAYRFIKRKEPDLLEHKEGRLLPDYRSVYLLHQAEEEQFSLEQYNELHQAVIVEERSHPAIAKKFRDIVHTYQPSQKFGHQRRNALIAAKRLSTSLMDVPDVPQDLSQAVDKLITFLGEHLQKTQGKNEEKGP